MTDGERLNAVRRVIAQLPGTSERLFDSGARRFYVNQKCFAYESADLTRVIVAVDQPEWEAQQLAPDPCREALSPASIRQRLRYVALSLADIDLPELLDAVRIAWNECAPTTLRSTLRDIGDHA